MSLNPKMNRSLRQLTRVALGLVVCSLAAATSAQPATEYHRAVHLSAVDGGTALARQGIFIFESGREGYVERLLLSGPQGHRWVLTGSVLPTTGKKTLRWANDATGDWVDLSYDLGFATPDLESFFKRAYERLAEGSGNYVSLELRTSTSTAVVSRQVPTGDKIEVEAFVESLSASQPDVEAVAADLADAFYDAAPFLQQVLDDLQGVGYTLLPVVEVVAGLHRLSGGQVTGSAARWRQQVGKVRPGLVAEDPELRRFLAGFDSIDPQAPLADHRLLSVAAAADKQ